jgi:MFS family permease
MFRALWIATVVSNLGTWMQNVGAAWLMTSLTPSPLMVTLVQTATSIPVFFLALPAGAMADFIDRRRMLLITQGWMLVAAGALAAVTFAGAVSPVMLLLLTLALGAGAAMNAPAWQATVSDLVPRSQLAGAISLNSAGFNIARAVGPALAGLMLAQAGVGVVFLLNAVSFVGVMLVLYRWRPETQPSVLPAERLGGAMRAGLRHLRHTPRLQIVVIRTILFAVPASAVWGLLPLVARASLQGGPLTYGVLLGGLGAGALVGAWLMPRFRARLGLENLIAASTLAFTLATLAAAVVRSELLLFVFLLFGGAGWLLALASLNASTRMQAAAWVQARALAFYLLAFRGGVAAGSSLWGAIAESAGLETTLLAAGVTLAATAFARLAFPMPSDEDLDLRPVRLWPEPPTVPGLHMDNGPVLIMVEYKVCSDRADAFSTAMRDIRTMRLRDGAFQWGLFVDAADSRRYVEEFMVESWLEHLRQHERMTAADEAVENRMRSLLDEPPRVTHYLAAGRRRKS